MSAKPQQHKSDRGEFDEAKLEQMNEPLTVTVEKMVAGRAQPIELPIKPNQTVAGQGWSKDDVRDLATFLGRKAVGAGVVRCRVTDVNQVTMKWEWFFSPQDYQQLSAPSNDPSAQIPVAAAQMAPVAPPMMAGAGSPMQGSHDPYSGWLGTVARQPIPGAMQPIGAYRPMTPVPTMPGAAPMYPSFAPPPPVVTQDDRLREEREARIRLENEISRKGLESQYEKQISSVTGEVRQLQATVANVAQLLQHRPGAAEEAASAETRALKEKIASLEASQREDKLTTMMATMQQQTMQTIAAMQASTDKQIAAIQAAITSKPTGPDPTMTMIMENQKLAAQQQMQFMQMLVGQQQGQLGPREWIELVRSGNTGAEQQAQAFSKAWELMMQGVETILHAQGPATHPALEMLGQGISAAAGAFERQAEVKEKVGIAQANATAYQAQANLHLANQIAQQRQTQQQLAGPQPVVTAGQPHPQAAPTTQPATDPENPNAEEPEEEEEEEEEEDPSAPSAAVAAVQKQEPLVDDATRAERIKNDREYFGAALDSIKKLRKGVAEGHLSHEQAAAHILQGVDVMLKRKVKVPAFDLWTQGRLAECIELMLPDAAMSFREKVIDTIIAIVQNAQQQMGAQS